MHTVEQMLQSYPKDLGSIDRTKLTECIQACFECPQTCTARGCLPERGQGGRLDQVHAHRPGLHGHLRAAGSALTRHTGYDANLTRAFLEA